MKLEDLTIGSGIPIMLGMLAFGLWAHSPSGTPKGRDLFGICALAFALVVIVMIILSRRRKL